MLLLSIGLVDSHRCIAHRPWGAVPAPSPVPVHVLWLPMPLMLERRSSRRPLPRCDGLAAFPTLAVCKGYARGVEGDQRTDGMLAHAVSGRGGRAVERQM